MQTYAEVLLAVERMTEQAAIDNEKMRCLRDELDEAKEETEKAHKNALEACAKWNTAAGELQKAKARAEKAEAIVAELTDAFARLVQSYEMDCEVEIRPDWVRRALSTDCGKGWLSPELRQQAVNNMKDLLEWHASAEKEWLEPVDISVVRDCAELALAALEGGGK